LGITVEPLDGSVRVRLDGELDMTSTEPFLDVIRRLSSQYDASQIELDMERLEFIDLRGVDALRRAARTVEHSGRMTIDSPPRMLEVMLDVLGARDRFELELEHAAATS
jgi:anti-anti-sigma factor